MVWFQHKDSLVCFLLLQEEEERVNFFKQNTNWGIRLLRATEEHKILKQGQSCFEILFPSPPDANFKPNNAASTCCLPTLLVIISWCQEGQRLPLLEEMQCIFYYHNASENSDWALDVNTGTKGQQFLNAAYHLTTASHFNLAIQLNLCSLSNRKSFYIISRQLFW